MDLKECGSLSLDSNAHWYYRAKFNALQRLFPTGAGHKTLVDLGAGDGFFGKNFLKTTDASECYLVDVNYETEHEEVQDGKKIAYRRNMPTIPDAADVLLIDVLEHIEDDVEFLTNASHNVHAGSNFMITVPAFQFLWSGHDEFLEHKRRYTLKSLREVVKKSGLDIGESGYFFASLLAPALATRIMARLITPERKKSQMFMPPMWLNKLLFTICNAELPLVKYNRIAGLSVFCVAHT